MARKLIFILLRSSCTGKAIPLLGYIVKAENIQAIPYLESL
ncbi:MAG: hypothetical protein QXQ57_06215 [Sulfolobales archaeon]